MATTHITQRPMIIVSSSTQKWEITKNEKGEIQLLNSNGKLAKIKESTLNNGEFMILSGKYNTEALASDGAFHSIWACNRDGIKYIFDTADEALKVWKKNTPRLHGSTLKRTGKSYYNSETQEVVFSKEETKNWFTNRKPLYISNSQYQRAGIWVEPGKDYVTISVYYSNRIQRTDCKSWTPAMVRVAKEDNTTEDMPLSFRLYNDGSISHFIKGRLHDRREYVKERKFYRTFDIRFPELYRLATLYCDLRSKELIGADSINTKLCPETLAILKKCGFPENYWCWSSTKRPFKDTYDLVNFITHVQKNSVSNLGQEINDFLKDKPFDEEHLVVPFKKGLIIRIPGYQEIWEDKFKTTYGYKPYPYQADQTQCKLIVSGPYEKFRVWISHDGKKRNCQELIHEQTAWKTARWDNVQFASTEDVQYYKPEDPELSPTEKLMRIRGTIEFKKLASRGYEQVLKELQCIKRILDTDFGKLHPELEEGHNIRGLLSALFYAPKLTETAIKIGYGELFFKHRNSYYYGEKPGFKLDNFLRQFGINVYGRISTFKEDKKLSLYQNLKVSKEQFNWIVTTPEADQFMEHMSKEEYRKPGTQNEFYTDFSQIPLKYIVMLHQAILKLSHGDIENYYRPAHTVKDLLNFGLCLTDIEKILKKNLDLNLLNDYLNMREQCNTNYRVTLNFNINDWPKIPSDPTDLSFAHNRILDLYNLGRANAERYWRDEEERKMIERQEEYKKRYKILKKLSYQEEDTDLCIVVPEKLQELVVEGQVLHHCVGSFVRSVSEGRDTIVFLRRKDQPKVPYATIALLKNGEQWYIDQAHTAHNGKISDEDVAFLKRWGKINNVMDNSIKTTYGLHCHH